MASMAETGAPVEEAPITFADLGIKKRDATQDTAILGKTRSWYDLERFEIAFFVISLIGLLVAGGLSLEKAIVSKDDDFTFALVLLVQIVFCIFYVFDGILRERSYEIAVLVGGTALVCVYVIFNFISTSGWTDTVKLVRLILLCVLGPVMFIMGILVVIKYQKSGNFLFRTVGANLDLQASCKKLFLFETLLKFDLQLEITLLILVLINGVIVSTKEKIVLGVGFPFSFFWVILGFLATRFENKIASWIFFAFSWAEPAYVVYAIVRASMALESGEVMTMLAVVTYFCAAAALVFRVLVIIWMVMVYKGFGKGLKEKVFPKIGYNSLAGSIYTEPKQPFPTPSTQLYQQQPTTAEAQ